MGKIRYVTFGICEKLLSETRDEEWTTDDSWQSMMPDQWVPAKKSRLENYLKSLTINYQCPRDLNWMTGIPRYIPGNTCRKRPYPRPGCSTNITKTPIIVTAQTETDKIQTRQ